MTVQHSLATGSELHVDLRVKAPVRVATTAALSLAAPGATIDGVTLASGDRVLFKNQSSTSENGIRVWNGAAALATRATDCDSAVDFASGFLVYVSEGSSNGAKYFHLTTTGTIAVDSTGIAFATTGTGSSGATGATGPQGQTGPAGPSLARPYALIQDRQTQGTNGGTFTSGAVRTRTLNTVSSDTSALVLSLSSNQFTLAAGKYRYHITAPAHAVNSHQARLQNITNSTTVDVSQSMMSNATNPSTTVAEFSGVFEIQQQSVFEVQHQCQTTGTTTGFGVAANFFTNGEVYTSVELWFEDGPRPMGRQTFDLPQRFFARPRFEPLYTVQARSKTTLPT